MKFLILAALVAVAAAQDYIDDVFRFTTLRRPSSFRAVAPVGQYSQQYVVTPKQYTVPAPQVVIAPKQYTVPAPQVVLAPKQYTVPAPQVLLAPKQYTVPAPQVVLAPKQYTVPTYSAAPRADYAPAYSGPQWRILSQVQEVDPAGPYKVSFTTENGIQVAEQGDLVNSADGPVIAAQGSYSYTSTDGVQYTVNWVADENGYRASGAHLPVPPPIPAEIQRSLEENAASNERYDDQGRLLNK